ncbi:MAG: hypothetical protein CVT49_11010 [candidate division Zixibacteria bacterium HGW-Zixibacteria-1]|nr:MAG: hypothetical protein CVT49_11010 [candidate division Zixibacteria bacterium HGW-Zixibacteria-1]
MFNFIHKAAVKGYKRELEDLINIYSKLDKEQLADYLIMSVWTRAGMQNEGLFKYPDGTKNDFPYLSAYPIMMSEFEKIIKAFRKRGLNTEVVAMSIWVHSLRGLLFESELKNEFDKLWQLLMTTKDLWDKFLTKFYNEDKDRLDPEMLSKTMALSKKILNNLPPKQSYENNK